MQQNGLVNGGIPPVIPIQKRQAFSGSGLMWRLLTFSFVVFFVMVASFMGLEFGYTAVLKNKNKNYIAQSMELESSIPEDQREKIVDFYSRLSNMKRLLDSHVRATNFFGFLEDNTDSGVYFTESFFSVDKGEVVLAGLARDYAELSRQLEKLRLSEQVSNLVLDSAVRSQNGLVSFEVTFIISKSLFKS